MNRHVNTITNRLSLRPPQRDSLEILARVCDIVSLTKEADPGAALEAIVSEIPTVEDFEREFPSLCFALATGVGKTRLMGAFITYLYQAEGIRSFFVLAPNLTIYNKLIADFTPNTPKYVFKGIGEFAINPPTVITGDTYESAAAARGQLFYRPDDCHINIFNISKINSEVRGGSAPRIKRLSEYIGQSYFDYLAGLDDLVMLMDGSHRYRATAGVRAINELKPILGLELTATPQVESGGRSESFKNVIYSYPLSAAMNEGFVKEPAVATRENFDPNAYSAEGLEKVVEQLLTVEDPENPVEIVIHVNMLKEGWDVTNLYTIVPLRAANSRTLVEQSIGRGLRLPYGIRVGVPAVDRLTIVSHDKFQEIVDHANDPDSIIRAGVVIGRDIPEAGRKSVEVKSAFEEVISGGTAPAPGTGRQTNEQRKLFENPEERQIAKATYQVIKQYERLKGSDQLEDAGIQNEIVTKVQELIRPAQGEFEGIGRTVDIPQIVRETTGIYRTLSIDVPKIVVVPTGEVTCGYEDFDLDARNINLQPVAQDILIQHLHENQRYRLQDGSGVIKENRSEDYLVRGLIDFDDISYDEHAKLLYKLSGQVVTRLREYLSDEDDVINVLQYHQQNLVNLIHSQMQHHFVESAGGYEAHVTRGFRTLRRNNHSAAADEEVRGFRSSVPEGQRNRIGSMVFGGFGKCLYPIQKFDSDSERRFAVLLENDDDVQKWFKPAKGDFQIHYKHEDSYEPDFVVETTTEKLLCEPKRKTT